MKCLFPGLERRDFPSLGKTKRCFPQRGVSEPSGIFYFKIKRTKQKGKKPITSLISENWELKMLKLEIGMQCKDKGET